MFDDLRQEVAADPELLDRWWKVTDGLLGPPWGVNDGLLTFNDKIFVPVTLRWANGSGFAYSAIRSSRSLGLIEAS